MKCKKIYLLTKIISFFNQPYMQIINILLLNRLLHICDTVMKIEFFTNMYKLIVHEIIQRV